jgi:hypothetical protein
MSDIYFTEPRSLVVEALWGLDTSECFSFE